MPVIYDTKKDRINAIKEKLASNDAWALRALAVIYQHQTALEQEQGATKEDNGVGFTGLDAEILTSFAKQYRRWRARPVGSGYSHPLSTKQMALLKRKMPKYAEQLLRVTDLSTTLQVRAKSRQSAA